MNIGRLGSIRLDFKGSRSVVDLRVVQFVVAVWVFMKEKAVNMVRWLNTLFAPLLASHSLHHHSPAVDQQERILSLGNSIQLNDGSPIDSVQSIRNLEVTIERRLIGVEELNTEMVCVGAVCFPVEDVGVV